jgi:hypothetical protein
LVCASYQANANFDNCQWLSSNQLASPFDLELSDNVEQLPQQLINKDTTINNVYINRYNVFDEQDPDEQNWLFNWLNTLHIVTKEQVIADNILFKPGEAYNTAQQQESERLLRGRKYIYDARIRPLSLCDNKIDVEVTTRDLWSLTPSFSVSRTGGNTSSKMAISDSNFLGSGKRITLSRSEEDERTEYLISYKDPNIMGTRRQTSLEFSDNSDGYRQFINFELPFYSLASTYSYGVEFNNEKRIDSIYHDTDLSSEFEHRIKRADVFFGHSNGYRNKKSIRWRYGLSIKEDNFDTTPLHNVADITPRDQKLVYPWISIESLEDNYIKLQNYRSIKRTEDINLGRYFSVLVGYSDQSISDDIDQQLIDIAASFDGAWRGSNLSADQQLFNLKSNYYNFHAPDWVFFSSITVNSTNKLSRDRQLFLGGDTGLRGYPLRYLEAKHTAVLSVEERFYSDWYWYQLIRVGAAVYFDLGKVWQSDQQQLLSQDSDSKLLSNIGVGLRLTPTRADSNHIIHLDLAFPLNNNDSIDKVQLIVRGKQLF